MVTLERSDSPKPITIFSSSRSGKIWFTASGPMVTVPLSVVEKNGALLPAGTIVTAPKFAKRLILPFSETEVALLMMPSCRTFFPAMVVFARGASMSPVLIAVPAGFCAGMTGSFPAAGTGTDTAPTKTSSPRKRASLLECAVTPTCKPAARIVCPSGVEMVPLFVTFGPMSMMRPPTPLPVDGLLSWAPSCTTTSPYFPPGALEAVGAKAGVPFVPAGIGSAEKRNWESGLFSSPRVTSPSLIGSDEATSPCRLICEEPPKRMPFALMT